MLVTVMKGNLETSLLSMVYTHINKMFINGKGGGLNFAYDRSAKHSKDSLPL